MVLSDQLHAASGNAGKQDRGAVALREDHVDAKAVAAGPAHERISIASAPDRAPSHGNTRMVPVVNSCIHD
jgi:hypothetical protein